MDGVEPDEEGYDVAPVPVHERVWRHPSEVGEISWRRSEPPLTIGRGLLLTTGAIGGLLALAVLWTTLPTGAGSKVAVASTPAARSVTVESAPSPAASLTSAITSTARSEQPRATDGRGTAGATPTLAIDPEPYSSPATETLDGDTTPSTLHVSDSATFERSAVAVLVGTRAVVVTTAGAIDTDRPMMLTTGDGSNRMARVLLIYRGIAVLDPDGDFGDATLSLGEPMRAGEMVTVIGSPSVVVPLARREDGAVRIERWGDSDATEGAAVINSAGQLVGLCRHNSSGPEMVLVDADTLRNVIVAAMQPAPLPGTTASPDASTSTAVPHTTSTASTSASTSTPSPATASTAGISVTSVSTTVVVVATTLPATTSTTTSDSTTSTIPAATTTTVVARFWSPAPFTTSARAEVRP